MSPGKDVRPPRAAQFAYIARNYLLSRNKPFLASFKVTYRCNLRCQQCPFFCLEEPDLTFAQAAQILGQLYRRGNRMVIFEGGEPMLWHDGQYRIDDLVRLARERFFAVGLTTNGTLPLDVAADVVWVSLDGLEETHNRLRGADIFARVMANLEATNHPRVLAHITANAVNAEEIPALIRFLKGKVKGITLQFYYPYNRQDALFLDFGRRAALIDEVIQLKRAGYPVLNSNAALRALKANTWTCRDWLIDNADPDGRLQQGCYLKGRADIDCGRCGFSPHTEISLACQGNLSAIKAGLRIFYSSGRQR